MKAETKSFLMQFITGTAFGAGAMALIFALCGNIFKDAGGALGVALLVGWIFIAIAVAAFLQIILHEAGHLIFGLLTGYRFLSFRAGNIAIVKQDGKLKLRKYSIAGTGGQCLLSPPDKEAADMPFFWYNAGGVLMNLITAAICTLVLLTTDLHYTADVFLTMMLVMGLLFAILNGIPMTSAGAGNDGQNIKALLRDRGLTVHLKKQLLAAEAISKGLRLSEMPEDYFINDECTAYSDYITMYSALTHLGLAIVKMQFDEALQTARKYMEHADEMLPLLKKELTCEYLFLLMVTDGDNSLDINRYWNKELEQYAETYSRFMTSKSRLLFAKALKIDGDRDKASAILQETKRKQDGYMYPGEARSDVAIMEYVMQQYDNKQ